MNEQEEIARKRFFILQMIRLGGIAMAMIGALIISGRLIDIPELGYVLLALGGLEFFIVPGIIAKAWRTPDQ